MSAVPPERAGMASGTQSTTRQLGGALGVAVMGSILSAQYSAMLARSVAGTGAARYLPTARRSLAAALQVTTSGNPAHAVLVRASRTAFVDGMHVGASVTAATAIIGAVVVFALLRGPATEVSSETVMIDRDPVLPAPEES
jgi:MFS transporter, DHA2 family, multidrug resistance protein